MTTDFRALCAELADELHGYTSCNPHPDSDELVIYARTALAAEAEGEELRLDGGYESGSMWTGHPLRPAALAAPVPEGPSDGELLELMPQQFQDDLATVSRLASYGTPVEPGIYRVSLNTGALDYARAALARWGQTHHG